MSALLSARLRYKRVTQPYKTSYWNDIPDWAKDADGHWMLAYTGTIAFIINKDTVAIFRTQLGRFAERRL